MDFKKIRKKRKCKARKGWGWTMMVFAAIMFTPTESAPNIGDNIGYVLFFAVIGVPLLVSAYTNISKWNKLEACVNNAGNTSIADIAAKMGKSEMWVSEQLQNMINKGFFATPDGKDAYIDTVDGIIVMTKNGEPINSVEEVIKANEERRKKEAETKAQSTTVKAIREAIAVSNDEDAVEILRNLEKSVKKVENTLLEKPDLVKDKMVIKMKEDYIPTILMLIKKLGSENFTDETKAQIKDTLVTCTEAFRNLNKSLNENDNTMTQVDIDVIKAKLASEGYLDPDFDIK